MHSGSPQISFSPLIYSSTTFPSLSGSFLLFRLLWLLCFNYLLPKLKRSCTPMRLIYLTASWGPFFFFHPSPDTLFISFEDSVPLNPPFSFSPSHLLPWEKGGVNTRGVRRNLNISFLCPASKMDNLNREETEAEISQP